MVLLFLAMATFGEGARVKKRAKIATVSKTAKKEVASLSQKAEEKADTTVSNLDGTVQTKRTAQSSDPEESDGRTATVSETTKKQVSSLTQKAEEKAGTTSTTLDGTVQKKGGAACMESDFTLTLYGQPHEFALPASTGTHSESCAVFKDKNGLGVGKVNFECKDEKWAYVSNTCQSSNGPVCRQTRFTVTGMDGKGVALSLKESQPGFVEASCADGFEGTVKSPGLTGTVNFLCNSLGVWEHKSGFCQVQMYSRMMPDAAGQSGPVHVMPDEDVQMMPHPDPVSFSQRTEEKAGTTSSNLDGTVQTKRTAQTVDDDPDR